MSTNREVAILKCRVPECKIVNLSSEEEGDPQNLSGGGGGKQIYTLIRFNRPNYILTRSFIYLSQYLITYF